MTLRTTEDLTNARRHFDIGDATLNLSRILLRNKTLTLKTYFETKYLAAVRATRRRKIPNEKTLKHRRKAVSWWTSLMSTAGNPEGPCIRKIREEHLLEFHDKLGNATYQRGPRGIHRQLSVVTQRNHLSEVEIILTSAGPKQGNLIRTGILADPPSIYLEPVSHFPKDIWTLEEARAIAKAASTFYSNPLLNTLARATIAIWFYTGHRATTYKILTWDCLVESNGVWFLEIKKSIKTGKADRFAVHPQLLESLRACWGIDATQVIKWPIRYRAIQDHHRAWQKAAGLTKWLSPQAWRRMHSQQIAVTGFEAATNAAKNALGHSSAAITQSHYVDVKSPAILRLPDLF